MSGNTAEALGKPLGVTVIAAAANLRASRNWVPSRIGPFDCRAVGHVQNITGTSSFVKTSDPNGARPLPPRPPARYSLRRRIAPGAYGGSGMISGEYDVVVVGAGNAGMCAALAAQENGARVLVLEAAPFDERGGNSRYTAGALRFVYNGVDDLLKLCDLSE